MKSSAGAGNDLEEGIVEQKDRASKAQASFDAEKKQWRDTVAGLVADRDVRRRRDSEAKSKMAAQLGQLQEELTETSQQLQRRHDEAVRLQQVLDSERAERERQNEEASRVREAISTELNAVQRELHAAHEQASETEESHKATTSSLESQLEQRATSVSQLERKLRDNAASFDDEKQAWQAEREELTCPASRRH